MVRRSAIEENHRTFKRRADFVICEPWEIIERDRQRWRIRNLILQLHVRAAAKAILHSSKGSELREAIGANGIDSSALARAKGLSIEQLKHLASSPLVTIGAHGIRHINLARAAEDEVEEEMAASRRLLQDILGREVRHFAYAFGACGPREAQIAKRLGFRSAVSLQHGTLFSQHAHHLHELPRQPLYRTDTPSSLRCKLAGVYRAYYTHFGDPIAHL